MTHTASRSPVFYGWVIVGLGMMMQAMASGDTNALYGVFATPFAESFGNSRASVMLGTASIAFCASGLLSPFAGIWMRRYSVRRLALLGGSALCIGYTLASFATSLWQISLIYGVCWAMGNVLYGTLAVNSTVSNWFVRQRGKALGLVSLGISIGTIALPPLISWVIVEFGWPSAKRLLALMVALTLPLVFRWFKDKPEDVGLLPDGDTQAQIDASQTAAQDWTVREVLRSQHFWLIAACIGICFASFNGVMINLVPYAIDNGSSPQTAALLLSIAAAFGMIGKVIAGIVSDRVGATLALSIPLCSIALACLLLLGNADYPRMALASVFVGLSSGGSIPVWGALIGRYFGRDSFSTVMGLMNPMLVPLLVICAPLLAAVREASGSYDAGLLCVSALALFALLLAAKLKAEETPIKNTSG